MWGRAVSLRERIAIWRGQVPIEQDFKTVYATPEGRRALDWLMAQSGVLETSFEIGTDGHRIAFLEGRRFIGMEIVKRLAFDSGELIRLAQEQHARAAMATAERMEMDDV